MTTDIARAALAQIRADLERAGAPAHGPNYWADRGLRISRLTDGHAVAWCHTCHTAARRGGFTDSEAHDQTWRAIGAPSIVEDAASDHYENVHASTSTHPQNGAR